MRETPRKLRERIENPQADSDVLANVYGVKRKLLLRKAPGTRECEGWPRMLIDPGAGAVATLDDINFRDKCALYELESGEIVTVRGPKRPHAYVVEATALQD